MVSFDVSGEEAVIKVNGVAVASAEEKKTAICPFRLRLERGIA